MVDEEESISAPDSGFDYEYQVAGIVRVFATGELCTRGSSSERQSL